MRNEEIIRYLNTIEKNFPIQTWVVEGINIWPIIRIDLRFSLTRINEYKNDLSMKHKIKEVLKIAQGIPKYVLSFLRDWNKNDIPHQSDLVFLTDPDVRIPLNNTQYDRICDPIIEKAKKNNVSSFVLEKSYKLKIPRFNKSFFIQPFIDFTIIFHILFNKKNIEDKIDQLPQYKKFVMKISQEHARIPAPTASRVAQIIMAILGIKKFFLPILQKIKPKAGFVVSYYNPICMGFILACKDLGIKTGDIQHGVQGEHHVSYGSWSNVPKTGYGLLPEIFLVWSEHEKKSIEQWSKKIEKNHRPVISGNLFLEMWKDDKNKLIKAYRIILNKTKKKYNLHILLTLQPLYDTVTFIQEITSIIKEDKNIQWWIRFHYSTEEEERRKVEALLREQNIDNIEIDHANILPLPPIMQAINLHITYNSSCILEAATFDVPSIGLNKDVTNMYPHEMQRGILVYSSIANLYDTIQEMLHK